MNTALALVPAADPDPMTLSIAEAARLVADIKLDQGVQPASVRGSYVNPVATVARYLDVHRPLAAITIEELEGMIRAGRADGFNPGTIRQKWLYLLGCCYRVAGLPCPIDEVKRTMKLLLRRPRPLRVWMSAEEVAERLQRVEHDYHERVIPSRRRDLALFRIVAARGLRTGEFCRVRIESDLNADVHTMEIRRPKVEEAPRTIHVGAALWTDVEVLANGRDHGALVDGGPRRMNSVAEKWKKRLGEPRWNFRCMRRSFATALDEGGATAAVIGLALGHVQGSPITLGYIQADHRRQLSAEFDLDARLGITGGAASE